MIGGVGRLRFIRFGWSQVNETTPLVSRRLAEDDSRCRPSGSLPDTEVVFERLDQLNRRRERLIEALPGPNPLEPCIERFVSPVRAVVDGRDMLLMGSNNYLGLTHDQACIDAGLSAIKDFGAGATASRVASGTIKEHVEIEAEIAAMLGKRSGVLFTTGFMANTGLLAGLMAPGDVLLIDEDCHASIYDAARLSAGRYVKFRHNDPDDLELKLRSVDASLKVIVTESVFSAMGDTAPLKDIVAVKRRHGAALIVDEAHSFGLYGKHGRGFCADAGVTGDVDIVVGTFSKAVGAIGGFAASSYPGFENLGYLARPYMFTAAPSAAMISMARVALRRIQEGSDLRERLWSNVAWFRSAVSELGYRLNPPGAPMATITMDTMVEGYRLWCHLYESGVYVNALMPPATPQNKFALRLSVSAAHSRQELSEAVEALKSFR